MERRLCLAFLLKLIVLAVMAEPPISYGVPGGYQQPKIYRHISLFVPQDSEEEKPQVRTIRPMGNSNDKHVQIIFVKAPSSKSSQSTEIILPPQSQQRTLVYVLVKKQENDANSVKIHQPTPTKPPPPIVYFIRYKDSRNAGKTGGNQLRDTYSTGIPNLTTSYGVP